MNQREDGQTDRLTDPLIEMLGRIIYAYYACPDNYKAQNVDFHHFSRKCDGRTDGPMDGQTRF